MSGTQAILEAARQARQVMATVAPTQHLIKQLAGQFPTVHIPESLQGNPAVLEAAEHLASLVDQRQRSIDALQRLAPDPLPVLQPPAFDTAATAVRQMLDAGIGVTTIDAL